MVVRLSALAAVGEAECQPADQLPSLLAPAARRLHRGLARVYKRLVLEVLDPAPPGAEVAGNLPPAAAEAVERDHPPLALREPRDHGHCELLELALALAL